jgi:hypothetical protein
MTNDCKLQKKFMEYFELLQSMQDLIPQDSKCVALYANIFDSFGELAMGLANYHSEQHLKKQKTQNSH